MVAIRPLDHLSGHTEIAGGLPDRHAVLHQPGRRRVPQGVWCDLAPEAGKFHCVPEPSLDRFDRGAMPFHEMRSDDAAANPPASQGRFVYQRYTKGLLVLCESGNITRRSYRPTEEQHHVVAQLADKADVDYARFDKRGPAPDLQIWTDSQIIRLNDHLHQIQVRLGSRCRGIDNYRRFR